MTTGTLVESRMRGTRTSGSEGGGGQTTAGDRGTAARRRPYDEVVGPKGKHDPDRAAVRHGHEAGEVTLGGRRVGVQRPRARAVDGSGEIALDTYAHFADRDPLTRLVLEQMLAGVSTRRLVRTREPVGEQVSAAERSVSKSAVSRTFIARTREHLDELMARSPG